MRNIHAWGLTSDEIDEIVNDMNRQWKQINNRKRRDERREKRHTHTHLNGNLSLYITQLDSTYK